MLGLGPAALEGGGGRLHHDHVGTPSSQMPGQVREGGLEAHEWADHERARGQEVEPPTPPSVLHGGGGQATHPAEGGPEGDVLTEGDEAHLVVAASRSVGPDEQRGLEDAALTPPGVHVDENVRAGRLGRRRHALQEAGTSDGVEAHAALSPHHQVRAGLGQSQRRPFVGPEPGFRSPDETRLHAGHHRRPCRRRTRSPCRPRQGRPHDGGGRQQGTGPQGRPGPPAEGHGQGDVHGDHHEADGPHATEGGQVQHGAVRPLARAEKRPRPTQVLPGAHQLRRHPGAGHHHHRPDEATHRGRVLQRPPDQATPGQPEGAEHEREREGEEADDGQEPVVHGHEEPGSPEPRPKAGRPPRSGTHHQEEERHQPHEGQPPQPRLGEGQRQQRPEHRRRHLWPREAARPRFPDPDASGRYCHRRAAMAPASTRRRRPGSAPSRANPRTRGTAMVW